MSKSIYEDAVEILNKYRKQNYNSNNKDEIEMVIAINVILPNYVKQEKLLKLYQRLYKDFDDPDINSTIIDIVKRIKELENE